MKKIILILLVAINMTLIFGQEWFDKLYHESTIESQMNDFSNLWLGNTFQGYIGRKYQRIEIRFLTISKDSKNPLKYYVVGKSKVNNNICDFKGEISIEKIKTLIDKTAYGDTPDISMGMLWGKYEHNNVSYVMAGKVVNIKVCGSHQHSSRFDSERTELRNPPLRIHSTL
jgi:hypothetical protein